MGTLSEMADDRWIPITWYGLLAPIRTRPEVPAGMEGVVCPTIRDATSRARTSVIAMMVVASTPTSTS